MQLLHHLADPLGDFIPTSIGIGILVVNKDLPHHPCGSEIVIIIISSLAQPVQQNIFIQLHVMVKLFDNHRNKFLVATLQFEFLYAISMIFNIYNKVLSAHCLWKNIIL